MSRTQGQPRRWPDLLIGLLVLLLLGGFAALLLGQRTPQVAQVPTPAVTAPPPIVIPSAPGSDLGEENSAAPAPTPVPEPTGAEDQGTAPQEPEATTPATGTPPGATEPAAPAPQASAPAPNNSAPSNSAPSNSETNTAQTPSPATTPPPASSAPNATTGVPVVPADPIPAAPAAPPLPQVTVPTPPPTATVTTPTPAAPTVSTPSIPPQSGGAVATSEQRTPLRSDYRISLGTFGSTREAQRRSQGVSDLGYTVYPIDLGAQVVAQVGPFADEATARQALADIQRAYPGAILYPPRNRSLTNRAGDSSEAAPSTPSAAAPAPQAPEPTPSAAPAEAATPPATRAPAPSGPVYLQVGAFDRAESAQNLVGMLREQGYAPTVNAPETEGRKVTVLIGPFSGADLTGAEEKLDAGGFDHFRVR